MALTRKGWKWIFALIAFAVIGLILYIYRDTIFGGGSRKPVKKPTTPIPAGSNTSNWIKESFPLTRWMYGNNIKNVQSALGGLKADGELGPKTEAAIVAAGYTMPLSQSDYNTITGTTTPSSSSYVGKTAYARSNGVKVFNNDANYSIYKTAKKDEWIGEVRDIDPDDDHYYLITTTKGYGSVKISDVYLQ